MIASVSDHYLPKISFHVKTDTHDISIPYHRRLSQILVEFL